MTGAWVTHTAGVIRRHPWVGGLFVFKRGAGLIYPPVESSLSTFDRNRSNAEVARWLEVGAACLAKGDTNSAVAFFRKVAAAGEASRDPEEGFFCDLIALKKLVEISRVEGHPGNIAELRKAVLERVMMRYDDLVPLQRDVMVAWLAGEGGREGLGVICAFQTSVLSLVCAAQNAHAPLTNLYLNFLCLKTIVFNFCGVVGPLQPSVPAHASLQLSHLRHRAHSRHLLPLHRHRLQQQHCHHNTLPRHRQYPAASAHVRQNVSASPKSAPNQSILFKYCVLHFPPFCC
jgi:hypothetical protein